jgi:hypothetical protein
MMRKMLRAVLVSLVALFTVAAMAEAAPKRVVHHRARHSSRVASGRVVKKHVTVVRRHGRKVVKSSRKIVGKTIPRKPRPRTKPR